MKDASVIAALIAAERSLLDPAVRGKADAVEALLHPDFTEIGQSGRLWSRAEMLVELARSALLPVSPTMSEQSVRALAPDVYLLTYTLDVAGRVTRRSSVWSLASGTPQILFHQGTRVP